MSAITGCAVAGLSIIIGTLLWFVLGDNMTVVVLAVLGVVIGGFIFLTSDDSGIGA
jgi:hypothetical protein